MLQELQTYAQMLQETFAGVLSGAISALISMKITQQFSINFPIQFILSATVAALTVGGKAIGKNIANSNSTKIVHGVGIVMNKFSIKKNNSNKQDKNTKKSCNLNENIVK